MILLFVVLQVQVVLRYRLQAYRQAQALLRLLRQVHYRHRHQVRQVRKKYINISI